MTTVKDFCTDFIMPFTVLIICGLLIYSGRDSEVKTVFAMAAGWLFKSGYIRARTPKVKTP